MVATRKIWQMCVRVKKERERERVIQEKEGRQEEGLDGNGAINEARRPLISRRDATRRGWMRDARPNPDQGIQPEVVRSGFKGVNQFVHGGSFEVAIADIARRRRQSARQVAPGCPFDPRRM